MGRKPGPRSKRPRQVSSEDEDNSALQEGPVRKLSREISNSSNSAQKADMGEISSESEEEDLQGKKIVEVSGEDSDSSECSSDNECAECDTRFPDRSALAQHMQRG